MINRYKHSNNTDFFVWSPSSFFSPKYYRLSSHFAAFLDLLRPYRNMEGNSWDYIQVGVRRLPERPCPKSHIVYELVVRSIVCFICLNIFFCKWNKTIVIFSLSLYLIRIVKLPKFFQTNLTICLRLKYSYMSGSIFFSLEMRTNWVQRQNWT